MYFAIGRTLPDVGKWVLSVDQRGEEWVTNAHRTQAVLEALVDETIDDHGDLVIAFALSVDPTDEIRAHLQHAGASAKRLLVLSTRGGPSPTVVESAGWAADWVSQACECVRTVAGNVTDRHVRLFLACPAAVAMFAGHQWNLVPTITVYEHQSPGYEATMTFPG
jgi:hypothetical protein